MSLVYLVSLWLSLPVWALIIGLSATTLAVWKFQPDFKASGISTTKSENGWATFILIAGLSIIVYKALGVEDKNGHWDAWWFWNMRANYLTRPEYWKQAFSGNQFGTMFTVPVAHSDYPPFLPLLNGLCWRILGIQPAVIPFAWSMLALLLIPSVLFLEIFSRNKVIAVATLFFFTTQDYMITLGVGQTADVWIALFLLLAFISYHSFGVNGDRKHIFLAGAMLGCCLWTKNEGMLLTGVFMLFAIRDLLRQRALKKFLQGISIPLLALVLFKLLLAPANDIIAAQSHFPWEKIRDLSRYNDIRKLTWDMIGLYFPALPYLLAGYFAFCLLEKKRPGVAIWMILVSFITYLSVYIVTPHSLGWHINTSVDRLIFQLTPAFLWIIAIRLCKVQFILPRTDRIANQENATHIG